MSDAQQFSLRELTAKVGIIGFSRLSLTFVNILINAILSRLLEKELYGNFQLANLIVRVLSLIFIFGVPISIFYFLPKLERDDEKKGFLLQSIYLLLGLGALISTCVYFFAPFLGKLFPHFPPLPGYVQILSFYLFFTVAASYTDALFITVNKHTLLAVVTIVFGALTCGAVALVMRNSPSVTPVLIVLSSVAGIKLLVLLFFTVRLLPKTTTKWNLPLLGSQLLYILPIGLNNIIDVISRWLDKTLVSYYFDPECLAVYFNGAMEVPFIAILIGAITAVIMPKISDRFHKKDYGGLLSIWNQSIYLAAIVLLPLFVFLLLMAKEVMVFLYSSSFAASASIFRIYLLLLPVRIIAFIPILYALGKGKIVTVGAAMDLAANFVLSLLLIPVLQEKGPAVATVAATVAQLAFYLYYIKKTLKVSLPGLLDLVFIGKAFLLSWGCALLVVPFLFLPLGAFVKLVLASVYFFVYYWLLRTTGLLHKSRFSTKNFPEPLDPITNKKK